MTALAEGQSAALAAGKAGLRYVSDSNPGIRRKNAGSGFRYVAVDGKPVHDRQILVRIRRLAAIVRRCRDLPGYELFQYLDADGERRSIDSEDVNGYLREITGEDYTAKDFRTWAGTLLAALALREFETFDSQAQAKKHLVHAIESVAAKLGNTPAICRSPGRTDETRCRTNRSAPVCRRSWHLFFRDFFPGLGRSRSVLAPIHDSDCHAGRVQSADQDQGEIVRQWAATQPGCHRIAQRCMPAHHGRLAGDGKGIRSLPIGRDARQFAHRDRQDLHRQPDAGQNCGTRHDSGPVGCDHRQREDDQITKCKVEQDHDQQSEAEQKVDASEHVDR